MSTFPVELPYTPELFYDRASFREYIKTAPIVAKEPPVEPPKNTFMDALTKQDPLLPENMMYTTKGALSYAQTGSALADVLASGDGRIPHEEFDQLLHAAWKEGAEDTLRLFWNVRSIHTGKANKYIFYRCMCWLREYHPRTAIINLDWIVRPVIDKTPDKTAKRKEEARKRSDESDEVMVKRADLEVIDDDDDVTRFDLNDGGAHGYYGDLLNLLFLASKDRLTLDFNPKSELDTVKMRRISADDKRELREELGCAANRRREKLELKAMSPEQQKERRAAILEKHRRIQQEKREKAKAQKRGKEQSDHDRVVKMLNEDHFYRAFHLAVARIFAEQIKRDEKILESGKNLGAISFASKWAPSLEKRLDRATTIATTIAELMFTPESIGQQGQPREIYLKHARQHYRKLLSSLRKPLELVETKISEKKFEEINYSRVPSIAMDRYKPLFAYRDLEHFDEYLTDVANGKAKISGATLFPSLLVRQARIAHHEDMGPPPERFPGPRETKRRLENHIASIELKVVSLQWNTLVQRIRDSGTLESTIAVVDVSGSMESTCFKDKTSPMDSALGLGLLIAQITKPPFANHFITFSEEPQIVKLDTTKSFGDLISEMENSDWGMTTNFNSVFEDLLLPMAIANKVRPEDMVKRLIVFSDMEFDEALKSDGAEEPDGAQELLKFSTNHQRVKQKFEEAGYEMPEIIYWNLAGSGRGPKPVTTEDAGVAMVSGYSQAMLKVFLEDGGFEDPEVDGDLEVVGKDGETRTEKKKLDIMTTVKKVVGHKSYAMLEVVD
ncbi:hypothetical protein BZA05DRAFT_330707 [Tricharina praecox]|uniref:uncharacterized protein n=1 Tax=Tricharina praecox TaxID=43433 RepID=UPI00221F7D88|nr:uncharacterized protein BZA05DRAFT_330707 [Tricharina praecox]KAI5857741.1 hypothetical protein BZA05DRAFT_330707 [Tricharina praecox]